MTFNGKNPRQMRISVAGPAPYRTTNHVEVSLEQQIVGADGGDTELGWIPVDKGSLILDSTSVGAETRWSGAYTLLPLRLVVREYELFPGSGESDTIAALPATRLVYAEVFDVMLPQ